MFGLQNFRGSCWVNAALQAVFRCPDVQERYRSKQYDKSNNIDSSLFNIWSSKGQIGLRDFFDAVRTDTMPAGMDIGDSHELFVYMCDKLPFLDTLFRFKVAYSIECRHCKHRSVSHDSVLEFPLDAVETSENKVTLAECIGTTVKPHDIDEWTCETCKKHGGIRQHFIESFPKYMVFRPPLSSSSSLQYSSILVVNQRKYALSSVVCFDGGHWWTYGRDMPPGQPWYTLNDTHIKEHDPKQFPISPHMRMLFYYRLNE